MAANEMRKVCFFEVDGAANAEYYYYY